VTAQATQPPPVVLSLLLCHRVILDHMTAQYTLVDTLLHIRSPIFPIGTLPLAIFCEMTNGHGVVAVTFRIVNAAAEAPPLLDMTTSVNLFEPLAVCQSVFYTPPIVFPAPGPYRLQAWMGAALLADRPIHAVQQHPPALPG
jgi:hypothetical protein